MKLKKFISGILRYAGYDLVSIRKMGVDPFRDMKHFLHGQDSPIILDVGANSGQTAKRFRRVFPNSTIHSFEPSPSTYEKLKTRCAKFSNVKMWNCGVGAENATLTFQENDHSDMSSFLAPSKSCWGQIIRQIEVPVISLDAFAREQDLNFIHLLKSDTQGYDLEVFKGASQLMNDNRIGLIYFEFIFSDMYKGSPYFHEMFLHLSQKNFSLVTFYESNFQQDLVSWTDVLFINRDYYQKRLNLLATPKKPSLS